MPDKQKYCKILVDEIHLKPAIHYQGYTVIYCSRDKPSKSAGPVLGTMHCVKSVRIRSFSGPYFAAFGLNTDTFHAVMIAPMMGEPAFSCRLLPVYFLKLELLLYQTLISYKNL